MQALTGKVHLLDEAVEDGDVERLVEAADVVADHLLGHALPPEEEPGDGGGAVLDKLLLDEIVDAPLGAGVEHVEAHPVLPPADHLGVLWDAAGAGGPSLVLLGGELDAHSLLVLGRLRAGDGGGGGGGGGGGVGGGHLLVDGGGVGELLLLLVLVMMGRVPGGNLLLLASRSHDVSVQVLLREGVRVQLEQCSALCKHTHIYTHCTSMTIDKVHLSWSAGAGGGGVVGWGDGGWEEMRSRGRKL